MFSFCVYLFTIYCHDDERYLFVQNTDVSFICESDHIVWACITKINTFDVKELPQIKK